MATQSLQDWINSYYAQQSAPVFNPAYANGLNPNFTGGEGQSSSYDPESGVQMMNGPLYGQSAPTDQAAQLALLQSLQPTLGNYAPQYNPSTGQVTTPDIGGDSLFGAGGFGDLIKFAGLAGGAYGLGSLAFGAPGAITGGGIGAGGGAGGTAAGGSMDLGDLLDGTGLTQADLDALTAQANTDISDGLATSGAAQASGQATLANQLQSFLSGGGTGGSLLSSAPTGTGSVLSRLLGGSTSGSDLASLLGTLGASGLQALSSNNAANSLNNLAQQYLGLGAPSRARFESSMTPGFDPTTIPGYSGALDSTSKSILAGLSAKGGNPFGNPGGLIDANKQIVAGTALPAIQAYQNTNLTAGGLGSLATQAPQLQAAAIGQNANVLGAAGSALGSLSAPDNSLAALLKQLQPSFNLGSGLT